MDHGNDIELLEAICNELSREPKSIQEISNSLDADYITVRDMLQALEKLPNVIKTSDPDDKRYAMYKLKYSRKQIGADYGSFAWVENKNK